MEFAGGIYFPNRKYTLTTKSLGWPPKCTSEQKNELTANLKFGMTKTVRRFTTDEYMT